MDRIIITDTDSLTTFCQQAARENYLSIDTEFLREHTYYPKLCLVQIGLEEKAAIIDPLADGISLEPLFDLLVNPQVLKVFHAASQDLEIFYHLMGSMVYPVYDTQVAAMALGVNEQISYHSLVKEFLNEDLDKASRMTRWEQRPLSQAQQDYAFMDVIPLYKIYAMQSEKLRGREHWLEEIYLRLLDVSSYRVDPQRAWESIKFRTLKPKQMGVLMAIAAWREETAARMDIPRRWVMADESVLTIAQSVPKNVAEIDKLRLKPKSSKYIEKILRIVATAEPHPMPKRPKRSMPNEDLVQILRLALHRIARKHHFASRLLCHSDELLALTSIAPGSEEWNNHPLQTGWRRDIFGQFAEQIARGEVALHFCDQQLEFIPIEK